MKKTLLLILFLLISGTLFAQANLFFSEAIEGSSNNKAIEIYNPTSSTVSLADYAFPNVSNAPDSAGHYEYWNSFPEGAEIAAGDVYVIAHPSADATILAQADHQFSFLSNGDDGFALVYGGTWTDTNTDGDIDAFEMTGYTIVDFIGNWQGDPGSGWDVAGVSAATANHTIVRKATVTSGNNDWTASAGTTADDSEWIVYDSDTFTYLGSHEYGSTPKLFFSEAIEGSSNNKAIEIYNPTSSTISLADYAFPNVSNAPDSAGHYEFWNTFPEGAEIAPGDVYVIAHGSADATILAQADYTFTYLSNGDDGFALVYGGTWNDANTNGSVDKYEMSGYTIVDFIGDWQGDPGTGWDVAGVSAATANHTIVRKPTVTGGNTDWTASAGTTADDSEWIVYDSDTFTYLGSHQFGTTTDNPPTINSVSRNVMVPAAGEDLVITADVTDDNSVSSVVIMYTLDGGVEQVIAMSNSSGSEYTGMISGNLLNNETIVNYWVKATDNNSQSTESSVSNLLAGTTSILTARGNNTDGSPFFNGYALRVKGVCIQESNTFSSSNLEVAIQQGSFGITVFKFSAGADFTFVRGNEYTVLGEIDFYRGKTEIVPFDATTDIIDHGTGTMPQAMEMRVADLLVMPEDYESTLIALVSVDKVSGTWGGNQNMVITDDGEANTLTLRIDGDTEIANMTEPAWPIDVVGVFLQYDSSAPYDEGYQILPRDNNDILPANTIPVELSSFTATISGKSVNIEWKTSSEVNNSGFEIQRKAENSEWQRIVFVEGNNGNEVRSYNYTDNSITAAGIYFYRLKQVDFDGTYEYSSEVEVNFDMPDKFELKQNFPNPFNPATLIRFAIPEASNVKLSVFNVLGQEVITLVNKNLEAGNHEVNFNASNLTSGIYYYRIEANNFVSIKKMMLIK